MNLNLSFYFKRSARYGLVMGLGLSAYTTIMWLTKLDTDYLSIGQYLDMAIIILPAVVISLGIASANRINPVGGLRRILIGTIIGLVSFLIYNPFLYWYHTHVNPTWFDSVLALKESELRSANLAETEINAQIAKMKLANIANSGPFTIRSFVASVIVLPTVISLLTLIFIKQRKQT